MSSFKRKNAGKLKNIPAGTRVSPSSPLTLVTSTGIISLDDVLGGGLPLSCLMVVFAPDFHSAYGELVQKYFIAQGLRSHHFICIVDENPVEFAKDIMWTPKSPNGAQVVSDNGENEELNDKEDRKIRIAWRYEKMEQFQTTVSSSSSSDASADYCRNFDLTSTVPSGLIEQAFAEGHIWSINMPFDNTTSKVFIQQILEQLNAQLKSNSASIPVRICIPSLGSPYWGEVSDMDLLYFLCSLRSLLRQYPHACASVGFPPQLSLESRGDVSWIQKVGWFADASFTLSAFSANPSLSAAFPSQHGLLSIHSLPAPHTLIPASDKHSTLRGLFVSTSSETGGGENNLTFRCTRKRLIIETLHLDIEGGVGERRMTPSAIFAVNTSEESRTDDDTMHKRSGIASVEVSVEDTDTVTGAAETKATEGQVLKPKKVKKQVAFRSDRPELYDF